MGNKSIKISAPGSVSNVGPGFDIMGFALDSPVDEVVLRLNSKGKVVITKITGDGGKIPYDVTKNTATVALISMMKKLNAGFGVDVEVRKKIGLGSGLGSSAASAVASVYGLNELLDQPFTKDELIEFAMDGEAVASGSYHADNVAPCLYGGFIIIKSYNPLDIIRIKAPSDLWCAVVHPQFEIKTSEARKILPKEISLKKAISQWGNVAGLVAGLTTSNYKLIGRSIKDEIIEPVRAKLIKGYDQIKNSAMENGALGCSISGSGPSIFALCDSQITAVKVARSMRTAVTKTGHRSKIYVSQVNEVGPKVI